MKHKITRTLLVAIFILSTTVATSGSTHSPPDPATVTIDPTAKERGYHYPFYTSTIQPAVTQGTQITLEQGEFVVNDRAIAVNTTGGSNVLKSNVDLEAGGTTTLQPSDTTVFNADADLNANKVRLVNTVDAGSSDLTVSSNNSVDIRHAGVANSIRWNTGGVDLVLNNAGELLFDEGVAATTFITSIPGGTGAVPVSSAYPGYVWGEITAHFQDLGYDNLNDITATNPSAGYAQHDVRITNGSDTTIRDYYIPDDQGLSVSLGSTGAVPSYATHTLNLDNGGTITIRDYYEKDTVIQDDQDLTSSRSGNTVTIGITEGGTGDSFTDHVTYYSAGDGLDLTSGTFSVDSPSCSSDQALTWDGSSFSCEDKAGPYSAGTGLSKSGSTISAGAGTGITATSSGHEFSLSDSLCGSQYLQGISGGSLVCANSCGDYGCPTNVNDTDSGYDVWDQGMCTNYKGCNATNCQKNQSQDYCQGSTTLTEFEPASGVCSSSDVNCNNQCFGDRPGTGCSSGSCDPGSVCPTGANDESAYGSPYYETNKCTDYLGCASGSCDSQELYDYCSDSNTVEEYSVSSGSCVTSSYGCPSGYGCSGGRCV